MCVAADLCGEDVKLPCGVLKGGTVFKGEHSRLEEGPATHQPTAHHGAQQRLQ